MSTVRLPSTYVIAYLPSPVPLAALGTIAYGEPLTVAAAAAPALDSVTDVTESPGSRPAVVKALLPSESASP